MAYLEVAELVFAVIGYLVVGWISVVFYSYHEPFGFDPWPVWNKRLLNRGKGRIFSFVYGCCRQVDSVYYDNPFIAFLPLIFWPICFPVRIILIIIFNKFIEPILGNPLAPEQ